MMEGWIKIHRKLLDWEWYDDPPTKDIFLHCLFMANREPKSWHGVEIPRGSFVTSYQHLAEETGLTVQQARTAINHLISTHELTYQSTHHYSLITVCRYDDYQSDEIKPTRQSTRKLTSNQQATNKQLTTTKEYNKDKNKEDNNIYTQEFENFWSLYPKKKGKLSAFKNWAAAIKISTPEKIIDGARRYSEECKFLKTEEQYIKWPQGWLSDGRWDDEFKSAQGDKDKALADYRAKQEKKASFIANLDLNG